MTNDAQTHSVLITTYHPGREPSIYGVVRAWLQQPVSQVWLLDGGGHVRAPELHKVAQNDDRFLYWKMPMDFKTRTDYGVALLTDGDLIWCADDDLVPEAGFVQTFGHFMAAQPGPCFAGVIGRVFEHSEYRACTFYSSDKVTEPKAVGFAGVCNVAPRCLYGFDTRGMQRNQDDLWHQIKCFPGTPKYVVPTKAYKNLPCSDNHTAMFKGDSALRKSREDFYRRLWEAQNGK